MNFEVQPKHKARVAVVGSGIGALSAAWFLSQKHDVVLFEKAARLGGHTNTIAVNEGERTVNIDTGFIVFNRPNYPNLKAMFKHLKVATQDTDMSFAVSLDEGRLEYSGTGLNGLFSQRSNLLSLKHWKMISEILRFNKLAKESLKSDKSLELSLGEFLQQNGFDSNMKNHYLLPMAAAIWSCPVNTMLLFPTRSFLQFFENHGLLNINDRPQWETVTNGSQSYIDKLIQQANIEIRLSSAVTQVEKHSAGITITTQSGGYESFDHVVLGCHADESYDLLSENLKLKFAALKHFNYQENIAYLHTDESLMPKRKAAWSSWNYLRNMRKPETSVAVSYWMNLLQNLPAEQNYFVTLNPIEPPAENKTLKRIVYQHPVFDKDAMANQPKLHELQGQDNVWLCGSYFGYGFHEDGLSSSVELARLWNIRLPWEQEKTARIPTADFSSLNLNKKHEQDVTMTNSLPSNSKAG